MTLTHSLKLKRILTNLMGGASRRRVVLRRKKKEKEGEDHVYMPSASGVPIH